MTKFGWGNLKISAGGPGGSSVNESQVKRIVREELDQSGINSKLEAADKASQTALRKAEEANTNVTESSNKITEVNNSVVEMKGTIEGYNSRINEVDAKAVKASEDASNASLKADGANAKAIEAGTKAEKANTAASEANTKAEGASTKAVEAFTKADNANTKAIEANTNATNAIQASTEAKTTVSKTWSHLGLGTSTPDEYTGKTVKTLIDEGDNSLTQKVESTSSELDSKIMEVASAGDEIRHLNNLKDLEAIPETERRSDVIYITDDTNGSYVWRPLEHKFDLIASTIVAKDSQGNDITLDTVPNQDTGTGGGSIDDIFSELTLKVDGQVGSNIHLANLDGSIERPVNLEAALYSGDQIKSKEIEWTMEGITPEQATLGVDPNDHSKAVFTVLKKEAFSGKIKVEQKSYKKTSYFDVLVEIY